MERSILRFSQKGHRIGFVVARAGYKKDGTDVTTKNAYSFKNKTNPVVNGDVSGMYYSTPVLNKWGKSQAVTRQLDGYNCCVTGFVSVLLAIINQL